MRKKLIELLRKPVEVFARGGVPVPTITICEQYAIAIADHLIANGVTIPVRCKDCKYWWKANNLCVNQKCCEGNVAVVDAPPTHFCSYGERRTDDKETG